MDHERINDHNVLNLVEHADHRPDEDLRQLQGIHTRHDGREQVGVGVRRAARAALKVCAMEWLQAEGDGGGKKRNG